MLMNLASCLKCKGDLLHEDDEWRCLQCGHYYYPESPHAPETDSAHEWIRRPSGGIAGRNINAFITAQNRRDKVAA